METSDKKPPIINVRGTKVGLGPFLPEHEEYYLTYSQDTETAVLGSGTLDVRAPISNPDNFKPSKPDRVVFTIFELENLTMIGESILHYIDHRHGLATFGISIGNKDYWGKGYGSEATQLVLDYGFRFLNLYNIELMTASFNQRAQKAYLKAGFKVSGKRSGSILLGGQRYDDIYMECLASEFEPPVPGWFTL